ncbi:MAG TPA: ParA family protein [Caulobacteraceae bacterium]
MPAIAFINPKGGAGKTTAALVLGLGLVERGESVVMIDADPNKPLLYWGAMAGRPERLTIYPAPTAPDVRDAYTAARRRGADWIILDTEGSERGAMAFTAVRPDLVLTPMAGSQMEAVQAVKAAGMVKAFGRRGGRDIPHRCLLTRIPPAIRTKSLKVLVDRVRGQQIDFLATALLEKEAFRALFLVGGGFQSLEAAGVSGVAAARSNASAYVDAVLELVALKAA